jgi:hypothetical protein
MKSYDLFRHSGFQYPLNQYRRQSNLLTLLLGGGSLVRYLQLIVGVE